MLDKILKYFDLGLFPKRIQFGTVKEEEKKLKFKRIKWTFMLYFGVLCGVISSYLIHPQNMIDPELEPFGFTKLLTSVIIANVIFPIVFKIADFNEENPNVMQIFIAFQYGFFWYMIIQFFTSIS